VLKRIEDIEQMDDDTKQHMFFLIDNVIQNFKTKNSLSLNKNLLTNSATSKTIYYCQIVQFKTKNIPLTIIDQRDNLL
jgi:hypothetical protein